MSRKRLAAVASFVARGCVLALAAGLSAVACSSHGSQKAGSGGSAGVQGDSGTDSGPVCGDGVVSGTEECDNGSKNGPGTGCELDCRTSCHTDADCQTDPCKGLQSCRKVAGGRACVSGLPLADGVPCGTGGYCRSGVCTQPACGNGIVDPGEDCEPPNTPTCSADCKTLACGDGIISGSEQCDDGNTSNLDGCDSTCHYETVMRFTSFGFSQDPVPSFCVANAFGDSFSVDAVNTFNASIQTAIDTGSFNEMLVFGGLDDLTGTNAASLQLGMLGGQINGLYPGTWSPTAVDEWYLGTDGLDPQNNLNMILSPASITAHLLAAGPSQMVMRLVMNTTHADLQMPTASIHATIDSSPAPDVPSPPPSAIAPGLVVFQSMSATSADQGMCGTIGADSLADIPLPQEYCQGTDPCEDSSTCPGSHTYTYCGDGQPVGPNCNSLLDAIVGGCSRTTYCVPAFTATQPDVGSGGNALQPLTLGPNNKATPLGTYDAYSFFAHFAAKRAHLTNTLGPP